MGNKEFVDFISKDKFIQRSILDDSIFLTNFFIVDFELPDDGDKSYYQRTRIKPMAENLGLMDNGDSGFASKLSFNVSKISMPGQNIALKRAENVGPQRFIYSKKEYVDLSISFIDTADLKIKNFFKFWISRGFDDITGQRRFFPDEMSSQIIVYPLMPDGSLIPTLDGNDFCCEIFGKCLPFEVSDYDYDVSEDDNTLKLTEVKFAYRYHISQYLEQVKLPNKF